jgi:hypothetical protein
VRLIVEEAPEVPVTLHLRIPAWGEGAALTVNGRPFEGAVSPGTYAAVRRVWAAGEVVELELPLRVRLVEGNPQIEAVRNQVAVLRGPLVYCLESPDLPAGVAIEDVYLPPDVDFQPRHLPELLGGVTVLEGQVDVIPTPGWDGALYRELTRPTPERHIVRLIPYFSWANRGVSEMTVWLPLSRR